jgi:hypothetical protein
MNTYNKIRDRGGKHIDNISPSRYISRMQINGFYPPPPLSTQYVGPGGIFFRADALQLLANIKTDSVDLAFTDPPFNLRKNYENPNFGDEMGTEFYRAWCRTWLLELVRVLKPGGSLFIYHLPRWLIDFGNWLNTIHSVEYKAWIALKMKSGFPVKGRIHPAHYGLSNTLVFRTLFQVTSFQPKITLFSTFFSSSTFRRADEAYRRSAGTRIASFISVFAFLHASPSPW